MSAENDGQRDNWKIAEHDRLRKLALLTRAAQRKYFQTRNANDLRVARDYERRLDTQLATPEGAPPPPAQESLFGGLTP